MKMIKLKARDMKSVSLKHRSISADLREIEIPNISSGDYMMSPNEFSELYYDGAPIFDDECQNAGMGPWLIISEEWATYKSRYGC